MNSSIAIVGAGLGGLVVARLLLDAGYDVRVYEQAKMFTKLGAGIHLGPNLVKILQRLNVHHEIIREGYQPDAWTSRDGLSGDVLYRLPLRNTAQTVYGAPYITAHRGSLHETLVKTVPPHYIEFDKRLVRLAESNDGVDLYFEDGSRAQADVVVGADGVNSKMREILIGEARPQFTGRVAYRGSALVSQLDFQLGDLTKWWGPNAHVMAYFVSPLRDELFYIAVVSEKGWPHKSSFVEGDVTELRRLYNGFHPELQAVLAASPAVTKWAMFEQDPLPVWSRNRIVLLGDACHPMKPHMGQGAAMAMEDAAVLARCLIQDGVEHFDLAFKRYAHNRAPRANDVQSESGKNRWLKEDTDPTWVFGYDALNTPLTLPI